VARIVVKISILTLLVLAWSGLSSAVEQNANSNPCKISGTDAAGLNSDLSVDIHALHKFMDTAARHHRKLGFGSNFTWTGLNLRQFSLNDSLWSNGRWETHPNLREAAELNSRAESSSRRNSHTGIRGV
jgi:hypothetical protein